MSSTLNGLLEEFRALISALETKMSPACDVRLDLQPQPWVEQVVVWCAEHLAVIWCGSVSASGALAGAETVKHLASSDMGCTLAEIPFEEPWTGAVVCKKHHDLVLSFDNETWRAMPASYRAAWARTLLRAHQRRMRPPLDELRQWGWFDPEAL